MKKIIWITSIIATIVILASYTISERHQLSEMTIKKDMPVQQVLQQLGDEQPNHVLNKSLNKTSAAIGEALFKKGLAKKEGGQGGIQSKHFVCTSCHNVEKEDPDLRYADPQARLEFAAENKMPFLQGTTMYGIVDRRGYYDGDYYLKYGENVKKANNNLREAIQLCAIECAQGRELDDWELESILAYLWTIGLKMEDLSLSEADWKKIEADAKNAKKHDELATFIKSFYLQASPATFLKPPADRKAGYNMKGNPENGKLVYDLSCKHCHEDTRYSFFNMDDNPATFKHLEKNFSKTNRYSLYFLIRDGTYSYYGKRAYMPRYTKEKLSDQQIEDLRAYIEKMAS
jgi:mono/diheme cytochrome c family protein